LDGLTTVQARINTPRFLPSSLFDSHFADPILLKEKEEEEEEKEEKKTPPIQSAVL